MIDSLDEHEEISAVPPSEAERSGEPLSRLNAQDKLQDMILDMTDGGMPVVGTIGSLSRAWGVTVSELRSTLRRLLESDRIALHLDAIGHLTIRKRWPVRAPRDGPAPAGAHRCQVPDVWIV